METVRQNGGKNVEFVRQDLNCNLSDLQTGIPSCDTFVLFCI